MRSGASATIAFVPHQANSAPSTDPAPAIAAQGWLGRARVAWRHSRFPEAHAAVDRARACALESHDEELRARVENGAGAIHYAEGAYAQAEAFYHIARGLTSSATFRAKIDLHDQSCPAMRRFMAAAVS